MVRPKGGASHRGPPAKYATGCTIVLNECTIKTSLDNRSIKKKFTSILPQYSKTSFSNFLSAEIKTISYKTIKILKELDQHA